MGEIISVERVTSPDMILEDQRVIPNLPPRTIVKCVLNPAEGSHINVQIWLPDPEMWNGRFLGMGNGGAAGRIDPAAFANPVLQGFASATTDMGTAPNSDSGIGNKEVWKDFGFRATHLMTRVAKQLLRVYYGREASYSYFNGRSTGGQQALQEVQRYPKDYDGVVAGVPAHCRTPLHAYFLWNFQIISRCGFTESQEANIIAAGNEYMANRETPVMAGKFVSDPRCTSTDVEGVITLAMRKDPSLTEAQAQGLRELFDGPKRTVTGERIFGGIPIGSSFRNAQENRYLFQWVFGRGKDHMQINFAEDMDTYTAALGPYLNAEKADLSDFEKRGGKLIIITGSFDSIVPYHATLDYYERVIESSGGLEQAKSFARLYFIPGMGHGLGPGITHLPSELTLVMEWREKGIAPGEIIGKRVIEGAVEFEMPLYPYPERTEWSHVKGRYQAIEGQRGGIGRVAERFLPPAAE